MPNRKNFNTLRNKDYATLGRRVVEQFPSVAAQLIQNPILPKQTDLSLIQTYFAKLPASQTKKDRIKQTKVFICAILHLYQPVVFHQPLEDIYLSRGLLKSVISLINLDKPAISRMAREAVTLYNIYEDFKESVDKIVKEVENGSA